MRVVCFRWHVFSIVGEDVLPARASSLTIIAIPSFTMSLSPTATTSNSSDVPSKRRRTNSMVPINTHSQQGMSQSPAEGSVPPSQPTAHIPKRGARACTACRKGKNRCEGEVSSLGGPLLYRPAINSLARPPAPARHRFG